ncbi:hypothetical protein J0X19_03680 [Hymenobacter sp. BT186]|uniref:SRPBCC family protein n=1 Tax=Hymenobacter telluris TaxID=2816474 RepID=A0A939EUQ8_9BACT|nr:hypothetical protein [Hymenobacter telluris]MBO0357035.1 hypothetical protein [Hymenobacter telluris]MBW3373062.1 hypothetical protein [Hymenobacter norwichensis]
MAFIKRHNLHYVIAVVAGLLAALLGRFVFATSSFNDAGGLLMLCFLLLVPMALGAVTTHFTPVTASKSWRTVWGPFVTVVLFLFMALVFHLEGMICVLIISPLFLITSYIGSVLYLLFTDDKPNKDKTYTVAVFALLPFLLAPLEGQFAAPTTLRRVENTVLIQAPASVVWQQIIRVPPIQAQDLGSSLVDRIGFPRPVEATLTHEGVGGVRHATFERGVEFIETVDVWEPQQRLSFSIVPNTATIPPTTFDEHVTVGGRFFDVLRGTYELVPAGPGRTRLVLYSQQRLSTRINPYAGLWTDYVMSEIQRRILDVIRRRCEADASKAVATSRN